MRVVQRHPNVSVSHLRLPVRERHSDLLSQRGVVWRKACQLSQGMESVTAIGFNTRRSRLFSFKGVPFRELKTKSFGPTKVDPAFSFSSAVVTLKPRGTLRRRERALTEPNFPR
jgi:hypothetical protein